MRLEREKTVCIMLHLECDQSHCTENAGDGVLRTRCTAWHPGCRPHTRSAGCTAPHAQTLAAPPPTHQRLRARSLSFATTRSTWRSLGKHAKRISMHTPASCAPGLCVAILLSHATTRQPSGPGLPPAAAVPSCGHKHRPLSCWHTIGVSQLCRALARGPLLRKQWHFALAAAALKCHNDDPLIILTARFYDPWAGVVATSEACSLLYACVFIAGELGERTGNT